jgi:uncharacterized protein (TIGR00288 family)
MITTDTRSTRVAVFIDFDNVEIGVKNTIGGQFDIGLVLDAIKERGEIVTKIAYSDWKRAGDHSRQLTQHAIRMVQRNLTPGGDKNGADITMALDALEMAFTHEHINAFVIVGGDSDFISLVEKLKQYGRKVIVVGGRQFTSGTMQRNCDEFIAYENLVGGGSRGGRSTGRGGHRPAASSEISKALPIVRRALKVLSDREVTPQLGLLKSTLLQLDSTFSEREYGANSFRDFMEKVAQTGAVTLKSAGRSMLVEVREDGPVEAHEEGGESEKAAEPVEARVEHDAPAPDVVQPDGEEDEDAMPVSPMTMQDGIRAVHRAIDEAATPVRWPMYVRQAKQFLRSAIEGFDERNYGFSSVVDLLRAAGKDGVLRVERDRQGAVRLFPGTKLVQRTAVPRAEEPVVELDEDIDVEVPARSIADAAAAAPPAAPVGQESAGSLQSDDESEEHGESDEEEDDNFGNVEHGTRPVRRRSPKTAVKTVARTPRSRKATKTARPRAQKAKNS